MRDDQQTNRVSRANDELPIVLQWFVRGDPRRAAVVGDDVFRKIGVGGRERQLTLPVAEATMSRGRTSETEQ